MKETRTGLSYKSMTGQAALQQLIESFKGLNLGMAAGWLQQMGVEAIDYAHDKQAVCYQNQIQRMIGAVEMLSACQVIDDTTADTACGLILRIK